MIGAIWKFITFTGMVNRIIDTCSNERIIIQVYATCPQNFDVCTLGHTARIEAIVHFLPHSDAAVLHFFLPKGTPLSETANLSLSLSNGTTAQGGPRPPSRVFSILPGSGRLLSNFYTADLLHVPSLHLPSAV
jgi:hypothetical protein